MCLCVWAQTFVNGCSVPRRSGKLDHMTLKSSSASHSDSSRRIIMQIERLQLRKLHLHRRFHYGHSVSMPCLWSYRRAIFCNQLSFLKCGNNKLHGGLVGLVGLAGSCLFESISFDASFSGAVRAAKHMSSHLYLTFSSFWTVCGL